MRNKLKKVLILGALLVMAPAMLSAQKKAISDYVNVFIGTDGSGHTFPGATTPFGMVQLSPDTRLEDWSACSGYQWKDNYTYGFSHTHLSGTGGGDLGDILFLPLTGESKEVYLTAPLKMGMKKESETGKAGYYSIMLNNNVKAELTATPRVGVHRYTYPAGEQKLLYIDLVHAIKPEEIDRLELRQTSPTEIVGMRRGFGWADMNQIYFVARFSQPVEIVTSLLDGKITDSKDLTGTELKSLVRIKEGKKPVEILVGISGTGYDGAYRNIDAEARRFGFDKYRKAAARMWDENLGLIDVREGATDEELTIFYTALYHAMICPNVYSDVDHSYWGMDQRIHSGNQPHYTLFSLWDTFRAVHPLFNILYDELSGNMMQSLVLKGAQNGRYPKWELWAGDTSVMICNHALSVLADAMSKNIPGFDYEEAYRVAKLTLEAGREQLPLYDKYGYIPCNESGGKSVSKSVEYAYNDYCMGVMAQKLGYTEDAEFYFERSKNYRNLVDGETGFFRPRENNGQFKESFSGTFMDENYTEATPWQYRHFAPHDVMGLLNELGGRDSLAKSLDDLFAAEEEILGNKLPDVTGLIGQYAHGNEPSHATAFLYTYSSEPWKTSAYTHDIIRRFYLNDPDGLCGNDDCGQMSAWYVFASMGFYPVNPSSDQFVLTAPVFGDAKIKLPNGKEFRVRVEGNRKDMYINSVSLNGELIDRNYITYPEIMAGGELVFELSSEPNKTRAIADDVMPGSLSTGFQAARPYIKENLRFFDDKVTVDIKTRTDGATIYYTLDGSEPSRNSTRYTGPFEVGETLTIKARAYADGMEPSDLMTHEAVRAEYLPGQDITPGEKGKMAYEYYEGSFKTTEDMLNATPVRTGTTDEFDVKAIAGDRKEHYGIIFKGWMTIDEKGVYKFGVQSDDGAVLFIDDVPVALNDGSHSGMLGYGHIALDKGYHKVEIRYMQDTEGAGLMFYTTGYMAQFESYVFRPTGMGGFYLPE